MGSTVGRRRSFLNFLECRGWECHKHCFESGLGRTDIGTVWNWIVDWLFLSDRSGNHCTNWNKGENGRVSWYRNLYWIIWWAIECGRMLYFLAASAMAKCQKVLKRRA